jgi:hypothetical protein
MRVTLWSTVLATALTGVLFVSPLPGQQPPAPEVELPALLKAKPLEPDAKDDELRKLQKARYNEAVTETQYRYQAGKANIDDGFADVSQRLLESGLELNERPADRVRLLEQYLEVAKEVERIGQARFDSGRVSGADFHRMRYFRIDAEIRLLRARREADKAKGK